MLRKWGTLVLLLLAMPILAMAQNTGKLAGRILDASTGEALPGANVLLEGTQMGTITDVDGNYFIIGVPVGTYNVQASFVGYQTQTQAGVEINSGYTREINFTLEPGVELNEIVVEYERPLIQKDAIGSPKVVSAEQIVNLPVRGVASVAALQGGVVANEGSSSLFIRGGREQEVSYYVDGVKVVGAVALPQHAIEEQEMLIGTIPARYGDAMSGIISITTKSGRASRNFFGSIEGVSSQVLDPFGYNLASVSLGGPIVPDYASFFVSAEGNWMNDDNPFARDTYVLSDEAFEDLIRSPMELQVSDADGNISYVPFPVDVAPGAKVEDVEAMLEAQGFIGGNTGLSLHSPTPRMRTNYFSESDFVKTTDKDSPSRDYSINGNLTITPVQSVNFRLGGAFNSNSDDLWSFSRSLYARDRIYTAKDQTWRAYGNWRHYVSNSTFYEFGASYQNYNYTMHPKAFSDNLEDALFYGDVDGVVRNSNGEVVSKTPAYDINNVARRYYEYSSANGYQPIYSDGVFPSGSAVYGLFANPGAAFNLGVYRKQQVSQLRFNASATTQVGLHQIEFGGEFEQRTRRWYSVRALSLAYYYNDGNPEISDEEPVSSWADLPAKALESRLRPEDLAYGYDLWGNKVDDDDLATYADFMMGKRADLPAHAAGIAPHKPIYYAGYIQDKIEYRDLIINIGLRVDVFDNNTLVLKDPYAAKPIVRAGALESVPGGIGDDYAVYFPDGNPTNAPLGYRDLDGNFYDAEGQRVNFDEITRISRPAEDANAEFTSIFEDYKPQVSFMPRIGVSFPVTDQALFFASYNVLTQRPSEEAFLAPQQYVNLTNEYIPNPKLKPETTTQYELGFRQRLGERAALQLSGFYRTQNNKIQIRSMNTALPSHVSYFNVDFATTKGATVEFDLRRTNNVTVNANYTFQYAQASGSDAASMQQIAWRGNYFPNFISAADFDRRHTFNVSLDYRYGEGEGPTIFGAKLLENFGVNVLGTIKSGMPYTRFKTPINVPVYEDRVPDVAGGINSVYMPWTSLIDLRVDRQFDLGAASLTAFLWVQNLLDQDNVLGVYRGTGLPDDDGFLDTAQGQNQLANAIDAEALAFHYRTFLSNPNGLADAPFAGTRAWGLPRRTRIGVRLTF